MNQSETIPSQDAGAETSKAAKAAREAAGLLRAPQRILPLVSRVISDGVQTSFPQRHLYSYANTTRQSSDALRAVIRWIVDAQREDGGIAAFYGLLSGYSASYPEVTGYIIPTLYDFAHLTGDRSVIPVAEAATKWLLSLQMPSGAFPGGLKAEGAQPSIFNTGQILLGLVSAYAETKSPDILDRAAAAGDWLTKTQHADGSWTGAGAYQGTAHTYYSMVSWALTQLSDVATEERYALAADRNIDWALTQVTPGGWTAGINLRGHPTYLHFVAYAIQGVLEAGVLRCRDEFIQAASKPAWFLLRRFETTKQLLGAYGADLKSGLKFTCVTGNAQMACVWLRLYDVIGDLRYLNAALKMNELIKRLLPVRGGRGVTGGVAGSNPIWGPYQPFRYISWGGKFFADALMLEQRLLQRFEASACES